MNDIVERLLPCPCGAEARIYDVSGITEPRGKKVVACIDPDCDWSMTGYGDEQATKRWNRRATQPVAAKGEIAERGTAIRNCLFVYEDDSGDGRLHISGSIQPAAAKSPKGEAIAWRDRTEHGVRYRFADSEVMSEIAHLTTPPSAPAAVEVTEEMVERYLLAECQAINGDDSEYMASDRDREIVRAALTAAMTKPGAGGEDA